MTLQELNPSLTNHLLFRSDEMQNFSVLPIKQKAELLSSIISELKIYVEDLTTKFIPLRPFTEKYVADSYDSFVAALGACTQPIYFYRIGWNEIHGYITRHFEQRNENIYVSYCSEAHPEKTMRHLWNFAAEGIIYYDNMIRKPITGEHAITPLKETMKFFAPDEQPQ